MTGPDWTAVLAIATVLLAVATTQMAWENRTARRETARRDREVEFHAALIEIAENIRHLKMWDPMQQSDPPGKWPGTPLTFVAMKSLLAHVWMPGLLWDRLTTVMTNLDAYIDVMIAQIHGLPPDAASRGEYIPQRNNIIDLYYLIDLYLKQLACYLLAEMRRRRLDVPREWQGGRPIFAPAGWRYDAGHVSVAQAVNIIENRPAWRPLTLQAPEPEDSAYRECSLERLVTRAKQRSEEDDMQRRSAMRF